MSSVILRMRAVAGRSRKGKRMEDTSGPHAPAHETSGPLTEGYLKESPFTLSVRAFNTRWCASSTSAVVRVLDGSLYRKE